MSDRPSWGYNLLTFKRSCDIHVWRSEWHYPISIVILVWQIYMYCIQNIMIGLVNKFVDTETRTVSHGAFYTDLSAPGRVIIGAQATSSMRKETFQIRVIFIEPKQYTWTRPPSRPRWNTYVYGKSGIVWKTKRNIIAKVKTGINFKSNFTFRIFGC